MNEKEKPDEKTLRNTLSPEQFHVTQECGTEPPFRNAYWNNKEPGLYVDVVSGEPLFTSLDKYDSGTGWPSFTKPVEGENLTLKKEGDRMFPRIEVRSKQADSHLGHVFDDGPEQAGGKRFCMNSAAMKFIPVQDLEKMGYGKYLPLFQKSAEK